MPVKKATSVRRPGAGRTKGANSFVLASMADLQKVNPNPDFKWLVSRKQLEAMGANNLVTGKVSELKESISGQSVETAPEVREVEF